jgi:hypothetical protein
MSRRAPLISSERDGRGFIKPRLVNLFRVNKMGRLSALPEVSPRYTVHQVASYSIRLERVAYRMGVLSFLNRIGPSIRNGVLLYKQLIRPTMYYALWRFATPPTQEAVTNK